MSLTPKQQRFVEEYLLSLDATKAAKKAGYSEKTAMEQGYQLLQKTSVKSAIQAAMQKRSERTEINQDWVLKRLASIADCSMKDLASWGRQGVVFQDSKDLDDAKAYAVKKVKEKRSTRLSEEDESEVILDQQLEIEQHCKLKALELIGKHLGMFSDKNREEEAATAPQADPLHEALNQAAASDWEDYEAEEKQSQED